MTKVMARPKVGVASEMTKVGMVEISLRPKVMDSREIISAPTIFKTQATINSTTTPTPMMAKPR